MHTIYTHYIQAKNPPPVGDNMKQKGCRTVIHYDMQQLSGGGGDSSGTGGDSSDTGDISGIGDGIGIGDSGGGSNINNDNTTKTNTTNSTINSTNSQLKSNACCINTSIYLKSTKLYTVYDI